MDNTTTDNGLTARQNEIWENPFKYLRNIPHYRLVGHSEPDNLSGDELEKFEKEEKENE